MSVKYTYTKDVVSCRLHKEIQDSAIVTAIDYVLVKGANVEIYFKDTLSSGDETLLDGIVSSHDNIPLESEQAPVDLSSKPMYHESSKPWGLTTIFTSQGDNLAVPTDIGGGTKMQINHAIDDDMTQHVLIDYNMAENRTEIHEGYIIWEGANFDQISLEAVTMATANSAGSNTNYNLYGGAYIIPAAGNGTLVVQDADRKLVEMPIIEHTRQRPPSFWNADWNSTTKVFENITPAPTGNGVYNMFSMEVVLARLVNKALFTKDGFLMLQTADSKPIGHGIRLKLIAYTNGTDHAWNAACILTLHRERTA